jgi:RNA polymerase sigma factor for flagellar operon FliA
MDRARTAIEGTAGRSATVAELAETMGMTLEQYHLLLLEINSIGLQNGDELWGDDGGNCSVPVAPDETSDPSIEIERKEMVEIVRQAIEALSERQRILLWLYYYEELTMKEIGAVFKVNESRVSQIHSKALAAVRREVSKIVNLQNQYMEP